MQGTLRRWFIVKWSSWRLFFIPTWVNAAVSLISYTVGWLLSTCTQSMPLARAGAFATAAAVGFTLYDYKRKIEESEKTLIARFKKITIGLPLTGEASQRQLEDKAKKISQRAIWTTNVVQAIVLIIATLVWGFGDLAYPWIKAITTGQCGH